MSTPIGRVNSTPILMKSTTENSSGDFFAEPMRPIMQKKVVYFNTPKLSMLVKKDRELTSDWLPEQKLLK
jgi:hypothetical protein